MLLVCYSVLVKHDNILYKWAINVLFPVPALPRNNTLLVIYECIMFTMSNYVYDTKKDVYSYKKKLL